MINSMVAYKDMFVASHIHIPNKFWIGHKLWLQQLHLFLLSWNGLILNLLGLENPPVNYARRKSRNAQPTAYYMNFSTFKHTEQSNAAARVDKAICLYNSDCIRTREQTLSSATDAKIQT